MAPHVAVLMCTYNGDAYIAEQLASLAAQRNVEVSLWVSDDGSESRFLERLRTEASRLGLDLRQIHAGPRQGFAANFLSLLLREEIRADYYAFADQDDIWLPDKLERAVRMLASAGDRRPQLYCSRTTIVEADGTCLHHSPLRRRAPAFANALVESIAGGNTMVLDEAGRQVLLQAGMQRVVAHDWWAYQLISGCGGRVIYDPQPGLLYRQHGGNLVGSRRGLAARLSRLRQLLQGRLAQWNALNTAALLNVRELLSAENRTTLERFVRARQQCGPMAALALWRSGVWRHSSAEQIILLCASLIRKI